MSDYGRLRSPPQFYHLHHQDMRDLYTAKEISEPRLQTLQQEKALAVISRT